MNGQDRRSWKRGLAINVPSVYPQTSVLKPVITVLSTHGRQSSAQVRDLEPSVKPTIFTEVSNEDFGIDRITTVIGAGSQIAIAQPEVKIATLMPSMNLMIGQSWLPPTNGETQAAHLKYRN